MLFEVFGLVRIFVVNMVDEEDFLRCDLVGERVMFIVCDVRFIVVIWEIEEIVDCCFCKVLFF